ncbi:MAG: tRNA (guanosine(37)-N1)-methyltransferase TrmD [Bacillota bacterium]|jgi:tRNA (guanine37-N1)-methyltransferase
MRIDILTLFPNMFHPLQESIINRAKEKGIVKINIINFRDFATDKHRTVDDLVYGGGAGMVLKPEPIFKAVKYVKEVSGTSPRVILTSPQGKVFTQKKAAALSKEKHLLFICGHYEGVDDRVRQALVHEELSIGDYVLTGGELPSMIIVDSVVRLLEGVLGDDASSQEESFSDGLLEYPQYTRPSEYEELKVPEVLLGGNHEQIRVWRRKQSLLRTWKNRPDLLEKAALTSDDINFLAEVQEEAEINHHLFIGLVHYPVYNKKKEIINTSVTNLDLHDIARAAATFNVENYFIIQPVKAQHQLINNLINHWLYGYGARYNPDRKYALSRVKLAESISEVKDFINTKFNAQPKVIATAARAYPQTIGYQEMREIMVREGGNYLLLFGTGWGLEQSVVESTDYILTPVYGSGAYNHLSVRSAVSIILSRLQGKKWR